MKKALSIILALIVLITSVSLLAPFASAEENTTEFAGGDGSAENPYLIADSYHLSNVNLYLNAHYKMISDIDFSNQSGNNWSLIGSNISNSFRGTFDGNGYSIRNLYSTKSKTNDSSLTSIFGFNYGKIYNLTVYNCRFISNISITEQIANNDELYAYASGLVLYNYGTISNCVVDNPRTETKITSSYDRNRYEEKGWVSPRYAYSGGIAVFNESSGKIINCKQSGSVRSETAARVHKYPGVFQEAESYSGGIAAINEGLISECFVTEETAVSATSTKYGKSEAYVTSYTAYKTYSGTIAAKNSSTITKCFGYGSASGTGYYTNNRPDSMSSSHGMLVGYGSVSNSFYYNENYKYSDCYLTGYGYAHDCYYYCGTGVDEESGATYASSEDFASGKVAFYLNGGKPEFSESGIWHQNIDNGETPDLFPVLDSTHGDVYMTKACSKFGNTKPEQEINHSYIYQEAVDPTCTESGKEDGFYCSICGFVGKKQYTISATGHSYAESRKEPNCLESGTITYTCHCGDSYTETIPATGHSFSESIISNATCTTDGKKKLVCSCGFEKFETIDATGHSYTSKTIAATCVKDGTITYTCHCGDTYTEAIPATGHNFCYRRAYIYPKCTTKGIDEISCSCGEKIFEEKPAKGHSYNETIVENPTCTKAGRKNIICRSCGDGWSVTIPAKGHTYTEEIKKEANCTTSGTKWYVCPCGTTAYETIPATGHSYEEKTVTQATCTSDGLKKFTCHCGDTYTEAIPATGHNHTGIITTEATCSNTGLKTFTCNCGNSYIEAIPAKGHSYTGRITTEPTCSSTGVKTFICNCGDSYTETISKIAHSFGEWEYDSGNIYKRECGKCDEGIENKSIYLTLNKSSVSIANQSSYTITTTVTDSFTDDIVFTSSNSDVASVNSVGKITAQNIGSATVTATIRGTNISAECTVNVTPRQFTITWTVDGVQNVQTLNENAQIAKPANPQKNGYKFVGWTPEVPQTMPAYNLTFTAVFEELYICPHCGTEFDKENDYNVHVKGEEKQIAINKAGIKIQNNPTSRTIKYGETLKLTASVSNMPEGTKIAWYVDGSKKAEGQTFSVSPSSGTVTVTVKLIDSDGNILVNSSGNELSDSQKVSVNSGFFQKIISFFKNLFGMNRTITQAFKGMF